LNPKLYIFDADGTLRWTRVPGQRFPLASDEWALLPNVAERLAEIRWSSTGPWLAIASNQPAVGEGVLSERLARRMLADTLVAALGRLPAHTLIEVCTCPDWRECHRKKPSPGMLTKLLDEYDVRPSEAVFVGDQPIDAEAARRAGIRFVEARTFFAPDGTSFES
jgi:D-glycero-D-manno-heptose 1,7-bisphosphate phosphatase